jgi:hypothetical protein
MGRHFALIGSGRSEHQATRPVTCLAFVIFLAVAFWTGAVWIAEILIHLSQWGY